MSAKRHLTKKTAGQKKIISAVASAKREESLTEKQDAIVRQFHRIQRGYSILMNEVAKEFGLVKGWLEKEATDKRDQIKEKLTTKIPRTRT